MSGRGHPDLPEPVSRRLASAGVPLAVRLPGGGLETFGVGEPVLVVEVANERGLAAVCSLEELKLVEAYMRGDIDMEGDLFAAMDVRDVLSDRQVLVKAWTFIQPVLFGRKRLNPQWIAQHYDSENMQLFATDEAYQVYTPGVYLSEDDSLEKGAERKLEYAFRSLQLSPGDSLLDVGCGWGGFLRYCAGREVVATGISLSRHQLDFARAKLEEDGLDATLLYQDFFTYEPRSPFDAISLMGSIEDLADYGQVMRRLAAWLRPGGRIYLDFASVDRLSAWPASLPSTSGRAPSGWSTCPRSPARSRATTSRSSRCTMTGGTTNSGCARATSAGCGAGRRWWMLRARPPGG